MKKLIIASNNKHKVEEIKYILRKLPYDVLSLKEADIKIEVEEDGETFSQNAFKKAREVFGEINDVYVLADDSGLMVDFLEGAPGVYSARFSGENCDYKKNNEKLLKLMKDVEYSNRKAKFVCVMVLMLSKTRYIKVQGETEGYILDEIRGNKGFGYDPLFYVEEKANTFAEMTEDEKNFISHRGRALEKLKGEMEKLSLEDEF